MRKLMVLLVAALMLAAATSLYAESVDFTVIPNSACSWMDLVGATLFVSIDGKEGVDSRAQHRDQSRT